MCAQCPDKPNVTNSIVCSSCGGAGHIARDCRAKRPGHQPPSANKVRRDRKSTSFYFSYIENDEDVPLRLMVSG